MLKSVKAVLFDFGGVIVPQPQKSIALYAKNLKLPDRFLPELFLSGVPNNAFCKLETGIYTFPEFCQKFDKEASEKAEKENIKLPKEFSTRDLFKTFSGNKSLNGSKFADSVNIGMIAASLKLRKNGILTCVLTNNWLPDNEDKSAVSKFMQLLRFYFDDVIESSKLRIRKPESEIYTYTCKRLGVKPSETIFLDDIGLNLKAAEDLGITGIKVTDETSALTKLQELTGLDMTYSKEDPLYPPACNPDKVPHCFAQINTSVKMHYIDVGQGPAIVLLHGFPDTWYSWRHQIPALACAGYRVIVPDQRGYGDTSCPYPVDDYTHQKLCGDIVDLLNTIGIPMATVVGHDWGGSLAWNLALMFPHRFRAVVGVNTPFFKINPKQNPMVSMQKNPGVFDYQLYFQEPGVAEREFEQDIKKAINIMMQGVPKKGLSGKKNSTSTSNVRERGGLFVGAPDNIQRSALLSENDLDYYVQQFKKSGFRGGLNWYRNYENNWNWLRPVHARKISIPSLMVTASHDMVLKPEYSHGMENLIDNLQRLHIERCSHWTNQEKPDLLNQGLIKFFDEVHKEKPNVPSSKL